MRAEHDPEAPERDASCHDAPCQDAPCPALPLMPRLLAGLAGLGFRHPWLVLAATALSCGLALWYTAENLTYQTHRNDLIGKNKDYYKRWEQYVNEFGDDDDMVVVVRGGERARMVAALEDL